MRRQLPKVTNGLLGTKFKLVLGYPGGNEMNLAMERGETPGALRPVVVKLRQQRIPNGLRSKKINLLFQVSFAQSIATCRIVPLAVRSSKDA